MSAWEFWMRMWLASQVYAWRGNGNHNEWHAWKAPVIPIKRKQV